MAETHSQSQLERMVVGTPPNPNVMFQEKAMLDVTASNEAGKRIYVPTVYLTKKYPGVTDSVATKATREDIAEYQEEYQYFLNNRQGEQVPPINIIPGLDIAHMQELIDSGLGTIPKLAEAQVPEHLEYARKAAIMMNKALQEISHAPQEESHEESDCKETEDVSAPDRQELADDVGRQEFPRSAKIPTGEVGERVYSGGQEHSGQNRIDNWKIDGLFHVQI